MKVGIFKHSLIRVLFVLVSSRLIAMGTMHFTFGLSGVGIVYLIGSNITNVVEGLVNWIGNKINKYHTVGSK